MKRLAWILMMLALAASLALWGCSSDDDDDSNDPVGPGPVADVGSISGLVFSASKAPLNNVTVSAGGETTVTNQDGYFVLAEVPEGEQVVTVALTGWMSTFRTVTVREGQTTHLPDLALVPAQTAVVDGATGGTAATGDGTGTVEFGAGAFATGAGEAYTGDVTVEMAAAVPDESNPQEFYGLFPGDFEGQREDGSMVMFESFGFMTVNLYGEDKAPLQLAAGQTAGLSLDIGAEKAATAPATIPMWYFDETDGRWYEEGEATLVGTAYEADVSHFTTWNWDLPVDDICTIEGYVFDADDNPVVDARVISSGVDYAIRDEDYTDASGFFSVRARRNSVVDLYAIKGSRVSEIVRGDVGDECPLTWPVALFLTVPTYSISLTWGASPSDLDSHLYIPMPWDDGETPDYDWYHLYYSTDGTLSEPPFAELDYDDTSSYGPENITGTRLWEGHYEYWVRNYSSNNLPALWASEARVRLEIAGGTWIFDVGDIDQPADGTTGWWHVFDFDVDASGQVTVDPIERFEDEWQDPGIGYKHGAVLKTK